MAPNTSHGIVVGVPPPGGFIAKPDVARALVRLANLNVAQALVRPYNYSGQDRAFLLLFLPFGR